jgi:methylenetetrahydrofolate dehydrogenase (NAD+)
MGESSSCKVVQAASPAANLLNEVRDGASGLPKTPVLVGFLANTDPAARKYAEWTRRTCELKYVLFLESREPATINVIE